MDDPEHISVDGYGETLKKVVDEIIEAMKRLLDSCDDGRIIKEGVRTVILGKPNAGKSSLLNVLLGEDRAIVTEIAGTTRDILEEYISLNGITLRVIDTAGIRRKSKVTEKIEQYSVLRAYMAVDRADVCLIVIDATEGFTEQDSKVAGYAHEQGKASIVVVNKWDLVEKDLSLIHI